MDEKEQQLNEQALEEGHRSFLDLFFNQQQHLIRKTGAAVKKSDIVEFLRSIGRNQPPSRG
ncbi:MAG: hypothetical protein KGJ06_06730 [Pseudomonadota bacterium]|nr:hypothetical protein [Pseudomonadota bacterium]